MKLKVKLSILTLLFLSLGSCNLFFSSPHGRENPNDEAAQITAFAAVPSGDKSVVTMWNWKDPPSWINDDRITEIKIEHSIAGYPENYSILFGENFTDKNIWQHEWKDLIPGITHYFSLFAKSTDWDGNDTWYAPIKAKIKLSGTTAITGKNYSVTGSLNVNDGSSADINTSSLDINSTAVAVIFFNFDNSYVTSATIVIYISGFSGAGDILIAPLTGYLPSDDQEKWNLLDDNSIVRQDIGIVVNVTSSATITFDISDIVRYSPINVENALLIKTTDGAADITLDNSASAPYIIADIIN